MWDLKQVEIIQNEMIVIVGMKQRWGDVGQYQISVRWNNFITFITEHVNTVNNVL